MKLLRFYGFIALLLLGFTCGLSSCSSSKTLSKQVRNVLADPVKFGQVRDTVFARGLCLNDTSTTQVVHDTVIVRTSAGPPVVIKVPQPCVFDTTVAGTRVKLQDGELTVVPHLVYRDRVRETVKTNTVRDKAKEQVLEKQVAQAKLETASVTHRLDVQGQELKTADAVNGSLRLKFYLALAALAVVSFGLAKKTFFI